MTTADGTGLVHLAPAFGADDLEVIRANADRVVTVTKMKGGADGAGTIGGGAGSGSTVTVARIASNRGRRR